MESAQLASGRKAHKLGGARISFRNVTLEDTPESHSVLGLLCARALQFSGGRRVRRTRESKDRMKVKASLRVRSFFYRARISSTIFVDTRARRGPFRESDRSCAS